MENEVGESTLVEGVPLTVTSSNRRYSDPALLFVFIIITKLDGTAKGGVLIPIAQLLNLPISFVGTGEQKDDLINFRAKEYTEALLDLN